MTARRRRPPSRRPQRTAPWWDARARWRHCARACSGPCRASGSSSLSPAKPGIGKTALVDAFQQQATADVPGLRLARGQCLEGYGGMEAYYPMLEALGQLCRGAGGAAVVETLATHAPTWLVQFPALMTRDHRDTLQRELLGATRERMLREIAEALETLTADRPLLLVFEDLQWVDPATVDLLAALARRRAPAQLLLVGTYRPVDLAWRQHPLQALTQELLVHQLCHEIAGGAAGRSRRRRLSRRRGRRRRGSRRAWLGWSTGTRRAIRCSCGRCSTT